MLKEVFHITHVDFKHLHTLQGLAKSSLFSFSWCFVLPGSSNPRSKFRGPWLHLARNKKSLSRMGLFSAKGLSRVCRRMEHPEEPSIATVTAMNAIHLQQLSAAHLKAPHEEKEHNKFLSNPSLSSMQALKICSSCSCLHVLQFYWGFMFLSFSTSNFSVYKENWCWVHAHFIQPVQSCSLVLKYFYCSCHILSYCV